MSSERFLDEKKLKKLDKQLEEIIKDMYYVIFEIELASWVTDNTQWPENRDYTTFKQWFDIEPHSTIFDMMDEDIEEEQC